MKHRLIATRASEGAVAFPISVHARARRATDEDVVNCLTGRVSIHARARRATRSAHHSNSQQPPVSIHARARRATVLGLAIDLREFVSIHARARRATPLTPTSLIGPFCFNPRARTARDCRSRLTSTLPDCFNPRARTARDRTRTI